MKKHKSTGMKGRALTSSGDENKESTNPSNNPKVVVKHSVHINTVDFKGKKLLGINLLSEGQFLFLNQLRKKCLSQIEKKDFYFVKAFILKIKAKKMTPQIASCVNRYLGKYGSKKFVSQKCDLISVKDAESMYGFYERKAANTKTMKSIKEPLPCRNSTKLSSYSPKSNVMRNREMNCSFLYKSGNGSQHKQPFSIVLTEKKSTQDTSEPGSAQSKIKLVKKNGTWYKEDSSKTSSTITKHHTSHKKEKADVNLKDHCARSVVPTDNPKTYLPVVKEKAKENLNGDCAAGGPPTDKHKTYPTVVPPSYAPSDRVPKDSKEMLVPKTAGSSRTIHSESKSSCVPLNRTMDKQTKSNESITKSKETGEILKVCDPALHSDEKYDVHNKPKVTIVIRRGSKEPSSSAAAENLTHYKRLENKAAKNDIQKKAEIQLKDTKRQENKTAKNGSHKKEEMQLKDAKRPENKVEKNGSEKREDTSSDRQETDCGSGTNSFKRKRNGHEESRGDSHSKARKTSKSKAKSSKRNTKNSESREEVAFDKVKRDVRVRKASGEIYMEKSVIIDPISREDLMSSIPTVVEKIFSCGIYGGLALIGRVILPFLVAGNDRYFSTDHLYDALIVILNLRGRNYFYSSMRRLGINQTILYPSWNVCRWLESIGSYVKPFTAIKDSQLLQMCRYLGISLKPYQDISMLHMAVLKRKTQKQTSPVLIFVHLHKDLLVQNDRLLTPFEMFQDPLELFRKYDIRELRVSNGSNTNHFIISSKVEDAGKMAASEDIELGTPMADIARVLGRGWDMIDPENSQHIPCSVCEAVPSDGRGNSIADVGKMHEDSYPRIDVRKPCDGTDDAYSPENHPSTKERDGERDPSRSTSLHQESVPHLLTTQSESFKKKTDHQRPGFLTITRDRGACIGNNQLPLRAEAPRRQLISGLRGVAKSDDFAVPEKADVFPDTFSPVRPDRYSSKPTSALLAAQNEDTYSQEKISFREIVKLIKQRVVANQKAKQLKEDELYSMRGHPQSSTCDAWKSQEEGGDVLAMETKQDLPSRSQDTVCCTRIKEEGDVSMRETRQDQPSKPQDNACNTWMKSQEEGDVLTSKTRPDYPSQPQDTACRTWIKQEGDILTRESRQDLPNQSQDTACCAWINQEKEEKILTREPSQGLPPSHLSIVDCAIPNKRKSTSRRKASQPMKHFKPSCFKDLIIANDTQVQTEGFGVSQFTWKDPIERCDSASLQQNHHTSPLLPLGQSYQYTEMGFPEGTGIPFQDNSDMMHHGQSHDCPTFTETRHADITSPKTARSIPILEINSSGAHSVSNLEHNTYGDNGFGKGVSGKSMQPLHVDMPLLPKREVLNARQTKSNTSDKMGSPMLLPAQESRCHGCGNVVSSPGHDCICGTREDTDPECMEVVEEDDFANSQESPMLQIVHVQSVSEEVFNTGNFTGM